jgi:hypothetical protein
VPTTTTCHTPPPDLALGEPDDRLQSITLSARLSVCVALRQVPSQTRFAIPFAAPGVIFTRRYRAINAVASIWMCPARRHRWSVAPSMTSGAIGAGVAEKGIADITSITRSAAIRIDDSAFDLSRRTFRLEVGEARRVVQSDCDEGGDHGFLADVRWDPAASSAPSP